MRPAAAPHLPAPGNRCAPHQRSDAAGAGLVHRKYNVPACHKMLGVLAEVAHQNVASGFKLHCEIRHLAHRHVRHRINMTPAPSSSTLPSAVRGYWSSGRSVLKITNLCIWSVAVFATRNTTLPPETELADSSISHDFKFTSTFCGPQAARAKTIQVPKQNLDPTCR